ncbi:Oidioi.mRNA.OKI2018_I69.chr2.g7205.t1.cds [Oikopleura dioica]|uniref:protein-tyrosine-phosphatase n=1 Tax=Oikopleura dioica TaxID=34765 RepID=A0ABN7T5W0_OIKDI|nr:Oidioi.mRNA.OKI2018_I69.chr2.g7205.t1.cds [Oikopleura dioica]
MTTPIRRRLQLSNLSDSSMDTSSSSVTDLDLSANHALNDQPITARLTSSPSSSKLSEAIEVPRLGADIGPETLSPIRLHRSQPLMTDFFIPCRKPKRPLKSSPASKSNSPDHDPYSITQPRKRLKSTPELKSRSVSLRPSSSSPKQVLSPPISSRLSSGSRQPWKDLSLSDIENKENNGLKSDSLVSIPEDSDPFNSLSSGDIIRKPKKRLSDSFVVSPVSSKRFGRSMSLNSPRTRPLVRSNSVRDHNLPSDKEFFSSEYFDFKEPLALPTEGTSKHQDLNYISGQTMSELLTGSRITGGSFVVVDARYPYEFEGGKIKGALNLFKEDMVIEHFYPDGKLMEDKPSIVIFHCEFSSERGPKMLRTLRNFDRLQNEYPKLDFSQLYLLKSGYKAFFENHPEHTCGTYCPMMHKDKEEEYKLYRKKTKQFSMPPKIS